MPVTRELWGSARIRSALRVRFALVAAIVAVVALGNPAATPRTGDRQPTTESHDAKLDSALRRAVHQRRGDSVRVILRARHEAARAQAGRLRELGYDVHAENALIDAVTATVPAALLPEL